MNLLPERQRLILGLVIHTYTETAQPVGSMALIERYNLETSSATIRNDMVELTEAGYLPQPHTSAGRVPTEEGYRYFGRQLMGQTELPMNTRRTITHQFYQAGRDVNRWMRLAASVLAHQSQAASLVTSPRPESARFKHLSLISTHGRQVLMVMVWTGGQVRQQMLTLAEPVSQEQLSTAASNINRVCEGLDADGIAALSGTFDALEQEVIKLTWEDLRDGSMVLARYGAPGLATGALGVLGPTRMAYGRTVSAVRFVSGLLSDLVIEMLAEET